MAEDGGKADATRKFIYIMPGERSNPNPLKSGQWVTIRQDLLPHIQTGLQEAAQRGFLTDADPADYAVVNMNMGWEIPVHLTPHGHQKFFSAPFPLRLKSKHQILNFQTKGYIL